MQKHTTIAIIGVAGKREVSIASLFAAKYQVLLFDQDQDLLSNACMQIGGPGKPGNVEAMQCVTEASWEADVIILTGCRYAAEFISKKISRVATQKIVIVFATDSIDDQFITPEPGWQQLLPHSKVITVLDAGTEGQLSKQLFLECNDEATLNAGAALFKSVGFTIQTLFTPFIL